jgi:AcrR family transcriptional regulator
MVAGAVPSAEPRAPLSRERVLRAAIGLADASGIEALTMRRLAKELGVEAMTLYYYVANKDEILTGITDLVVGEFELPPGDVDWKQGLRLTAISAHRVLLRHGWAANLMLSGSDARPARLHHMEAILDSLRSAGFSAEMTHHAYHALESHIMGFTLWLVGMALDAQKLPGMAADFLEQLPREEFPRLAEHIETHFVAPVEYVGTEFEFGLDLILDGLERIRLEA